MRKTRIQTLSQALLDVDSIDAEISLIEASDRVVTTSTARLLQRARTVLHELQSRGVSAGSQLIICVPGLTEFVDAFWACQLGGIVAVPVSVAQHAQGKRRLFSVFEALDDPYLLSNRRTLESYETFARSEGEALDACFRRMVQRSLATNEFTGATLSEGCHTPNPSEIALIQFSSGSTGDPKGVELSHENLLSNIYAIAEAAELNSSDRLLSWMPLTHDMGLIGFHLVPVVLGLDHALMPVSLFARRPLLWLKTAAERESTILASPNFGYQHVLNAMRTGDPGAIDLGRVRLIFNGAEPVSTSVANAFLDALAPSGLDRRTMFPVYGLAEASLGVSFPTPGGALVIRHVDRRYLRPGDIVREVAQTDPQSRALVGLGRSIPGCEMRIAWNGEEVPVGRVGAIQLRGSNVSRSYHGFEKQRAVDEWLDTGDLGFVCDDLYVVGRQKDIVILNGACLHAADLEEICIQTGLVQPGRIACFGIEATTGEELVVCVQDRGELDEFLVLARRLKRELSQRAFVLTAEVLPVPEIPKTTSGKVKRYEMAEAYRRGDFENVRSELSELTVNKPTDSENELLTPTQSLLLTICREVITTSEVNVDDDLLDVGASSLALAEICEEIEASFPGRFELSDFLEFSSVAALSQYLDNDTK